MALTATDPLAQIDPQFLVPMKGGKLHPTYPGVLAAAMANGLREITVKLLQAPSETNGGLAISEATAVFTGPDGRDRVFTEIGDADGHNTGTHIAPHRVRMSATRAKGRALRDALGLGVALAEEMGPDMGEAPGRDRAPVAGVREQGGSQRREAAPRQQPRERAAAAPVGDTSGDRRAQAGALADVAPGAAVAPVAEFCEECGLQIEGIETKKGPVSVATIVQISEQRWGKALCHGCGKKRMEIEQANVPTGELVPT